MSVKRRRMHDCVDGVLQNHAHACLWVLRRFGFLDPAACTAQHASQQMPYFPYATDHSYCLRCLEARFDTYAAFGSDIPADLLSDGAGPIMGAK